MHDNDQFPPAHNTLKNGVALEATLCSLTCNSKCSATAPRHWCSYKVHITCGYEINVTLMWPKHRSGMCTL